MLPPVSWQSPCAAARRGDPISCHCGVATKVVCRWRWSAVVVTEELLLAWQTERGSSSSSSSSSVQCMDRALFPRVVARAFPPHHRSTRRRGVAAVMVRVAQTSDHVRRLPRPLRLPRHSLSLRQTLCCYPRRRVRAMPVLSTQPRQQLLRSSALLDAGKRSEVIDMLLLDRPVAVDSSWAPTCFFNPVFSAPHFQAKLLLQPPDAAPVSLQATSV
jgi:hypothetical protein